MYHSVTARTRTGRGHEAFVGGASFLDDTATYPHAAHVLVAATKESKSPIRIWSAVTCTRRCCEAAWGRPRPLVRKRSIRRRNGVDGVGELVGRPCSGPFSSTRLLCRRGRQQLQAAERPCVKRLRTLDDAQVCVREHGLFIARTMAVPPSLCHLRPENITKFESNNEYTTQSDGTDDRRAPAPEKQGGKALAGGPAVRANTGAAQNS